MSDESRDLIEGFKTFPVFVELLDTKIVYVRTESGVWYFPIKATCEALGVSFSSQRDVLAHPDNADLYGAEDVQRIFRIETNGGRQAVMCMRRKEYAYWLTHISPARVHRELRGKLDAIRDAMMAKADRLVFGDLSDVTVDPARQVQRPVGGFIRFACRRCGAPHILHVTPDGSFVEIDEDD